jgi:MoaA/NifB/PqqE/SkfB family radical SAM enzyme
VFPQFPEKLADPGPETLPEQRKWTASQILRATRGWLVPYLRSRVLPGDFRPITAYLFVEYKCNLDCWYCPSYDNNVKGMSEDIARRSIDWLYDHGGRVLALMGGEPLLRPKSVHKIVYYAARKGVWVYIATNGRLMRPDVADRLGDAGVAVINLALDSWEEKESLPKAFLPVEKNLEHMQRKQYVCGYMIFFNINICRNNHEAVKQLTERAREHRIATDYHINERLMLDQSDHFRHKENNPTYIGPEDWRAVDELVDAAVEANAMLSAARAWYAAIVFPAMPVATG